MRQYIEDMKYRMELKFAHHNESSCKGCLALGEESRFITVMDGNEAVSRIVCMAQADGFVETPYGVGIAMGCSEAPVSHSRFCSVHRKFREQEDAVSLSQVSSVSDTAQHSTSGVSTRQRSKKRTYDMIKSNEFVVESVNAHKYIPATDKFPVRVQYHVSFLGFDDNVDGGWWVDESDIDDSLVAEYWRRPRKQRFLHGTQDLAAQEQLLLQWSVSHEIDNITAVPEDSDACNTEKDRGKKRVSGVCHSRGTLMHLRSCGYICNFLQMMRKEGCTQISVLMSKHLQQFPEEDDSKHCLIYDDACHVQPFFRNPKRCNINTVRVQ